VAEATEVAAVIDPVGLSGKARGFDLTQQHYFRFNPIYLGGQFGIA
jgi:hypothetical protein